MTSRAQIMILVLVLTGFVANTSQAMNLQDPQAPVEQAQDSIDQLRLLPEQRQRIRAIIEQTRDERQMVNRRVREANVALDEALDALDENVIEQRMAELTAAQAAQTRFRVQTEVRVRRVLTPEQRATLEKLHIQIRDVMGQRPDRRAIQNGMRPNQGNGIAPLRRNVPLRTPRP